MIEVKNDYAITTIQEFNSQISELKEIAKAYYKSYYASKGEFTELKETSQGYSFRIDKLTREVVKYHDYWEQLIVTLNFEAKEGYSDVVIVKHYIEGFYQAKRGENPTYSNSLEKDKFSELVNYGLILRNEFSEYLKK